MKTPNFGLEPQKTGRFYNVYNPVSASPTTSKNDVLQERHGFSRAFCTAPYPPKKISRKGRGIPSFAYYSWKCFFLGGIQRSESRRDG